MMQASETCDFRQVRNDIRGRELSILAGMSISLPKKQNIGGACPNCGGSDRFSWAVKDSDWIYNCRECGGGDAFSLIAKVEGCPKRAAQAITGASPIETYQPQEETQKDHSKAIRKAQSILSTVSNRNDHPYLESRGLTGVEVDCLSAQVREGGVLFSKGDIVVPISDGENDINVQLINEQGEKRYLKGGQKQGCYHLLGADNPKQIFVVEGFATGVTVWEAFDKKEVVAVAFDAGNLSGVADKLREHGLPLIFMADNDQSGVGQKKARAAAKNGERVCTPPVVGDWDDYRQSGGSIKEAIEPKTSEKKLKQPYIAYPDLKDDNKPLGTYDNVKALVSGLGLTPASNSMNLELEMLKDGKPLNMSYEAKRSMLISEALKSGLPKSAIEDHMNALSENATYHPVKAWLSGDSWDGVGRVEKVIDAMNAKDRKAAGAAMNKWLVACVAALYEPNFTCKLVPVLQGEQSFMKTAFISRFADVVNGSFLEGAELNPDNKDSILSCIKSWVVELGELERTSKNSQGSLKAFITKNIDSVRPPYGRCDIKKKRQTVFIASVNGSEFLRDETGSSRYAVIELSKAIDMGAVNELLGWEYKDGRVNLADESKLKQFWLEVKHQYDSGASWMLSNDELILFSKLNDEHKFKSNWRFELEEKFLDVDMSVRSMEWLKASEVCAYCDFPKGRAREVGRALAGMAKDGLIETKRGGKNITRYHLPTITVS